MAPKFVEKMLAKLDGDDSTTSTSSTTAGTQSGRGDYGTGSSNTVGEDASTARGTGSTLASSGQETAYSSSDSGAARNTDSTLASSAQDTSTSSSSSVPSDGKFETISQTDAPAVEHERVTRTHHEEVNPVVDREREQHHYHTTVQPLTDSETKPERHREQTADVEYREFEHGDNAKVQERLAAEQAQFQSTRTEGATETTTSQNPTAVSERTHHHLHETVQPVIEKETVVPTVTHTTVPIKETHHEAAQFHGTTTQPTMSVDEFKRTGGSTLTGNNTTDTTSSGI